MLMALYLAGVCVNVDIQLIDLCLIVFLKLRALQLEGRGHEVIFSGPDLSVEQNILH